MIALINAIAKLSSTPGHASVLQALKKIDLTVTEDFFVQLLDHAEWVVDFSALAAALVAPKLYSEREIVELSRRRPRFNPTKAKPEKFFADDPIVKESVDRKLIMAPPMKTDWPSFVYYCDSDINQTSSLLFLIL
jgi:hypothetical protein